MTTTDTTGVTREQEREAIASVPTGLFIGGEWRTTAATMSVVDPSTGQPLCEIADATPDEAAAALDAAAAAQADWARTPPRERSEILTRARDLMLADVDRLALIMTLEMGKPL
ncbi:MAG: aldehyde dehydrogenase family protein, partial [Janibacter sp.]|nr:aldehyde dehydrogenase family protein [Janibacter sp.]